MVVCVGEAAPRPRKRPFTSLTVPYDTVAAQPLLLYNDVIIHHYEIL
jgi:hypothetical protein